MISASVRSYSLGLLSQSRSVSKILQFCLSIFVYGVAVWIYYCFFEVYALVYGPMYGFKVGETAIVFTFIIIGCFIALVIYFSYPK
jgi:hypothetical protein